MKAILFALGVICAVAGNNLGQVALPEPRVIEVSASAERWVTPDEFTFKITLLERMENKQKVTIEQQESALRRELSALGVDVAKDLSVFDISSSYFRQKKVRDVLGSKNYRLKLRDLNQISRLQDLADRLNISRLDLIDSEHSQITQFRRETKIDAMKAAREKADYLLSSIGQRAGKPIFIKEEPDEAPRSQYANYASNITSNTMVLDGADTRDSSSLSFSQIKLRYVITAKFEIE